MVTNIGAQDLENLIKTTPEAVEVIDVRTPEEFRQMHIKGSKLIPIEILEKDMDKIDWAKDVIFVCRSGNTSLYASDLVVSKGKNAKNLEGGIIGVQRWGFSDILERA